MPSSIGRCFSRRWLADFATAMPAITPTIQPFVVLRGLRGLRGWSNWCRLDVRLVSRRSEAGYRLYTPDDLMWLQHILALHYLGFGLNAIRHCLTHPDYTLVRVIHLHIQRMQEQIAMQQLLCRRLEALAAACEQIDSVSVTDVTAIVKVIRTMEHRTYAERSAALRVARKVSAIVGVTPTEVACTTCWYAAGAEVRYGPAPTPASQCPSHRSAPNCAGAGRQTPP